MEKTYEDGLRECLEILDQVYGNKYPSKRLIIKVAIMKKIFNIPSRRKNV